jgi:LmbE family N-acetylglucosaminyl deacetylase
MPARAAPRRSSCGPRCERVSAARPHAADRLLAGLAGGLRIDARAIAVVVAHPDDETIGLGAQLRRLDGVTIVHVADGAPRNGEDASRHGFSGRDDYAAARRRELEAAVAFAGIGLDALIALDVPDQEAALDLPGVARRLAALFAERGVEVVLTHAYEGGHPDHDAVAFAVHAAARLGAAPSIVEMPFYRAGPEDGWVTQAFAADPRAPEIALWLDDHARALKRHMMGAHVTQGATLAGFAPAVERFRRAPAYDFTALPNCGDLLYERYAWGMTGAGFRDLVRAAQAALGLPAAA